MKENKSDFLTHKQRVKFVLKVFPWTNIFILPAIAITATNTVFVVLIYLLIPILGISSLKLGINFEKQRLFKNLSSLLNSINMFLICWLAGPTSPSFVIGIIVIGANILSSTDRKDLIFTIIGFISSIICGSYLGGKTFSDIFIMLMILVTYSIILLKVLEFTLIQGREIGNQKQLIEEKNKDILDSIRYAKRIQTSLLPTEKYIDRILTKTDKSSEA